MPLSRYQIRNEYGLGDQQLYKVADKDDAEALLEGVAMAGLVGLLRQLGDLAEFAAEVFHDLHEEVMATAARGYSLIIRVQQLEAEFPLIESTLLTQTTHTSFLYNPGVDWRPNLHMDQKLVSRGDLPRFVMDSYEECRGPPLLFLLDKFDVAGAGACLKRYTDPSFFKTESISSNDRKPEGQREKKTRRVKKQASRWRNGDTLESFPSSHAKLHQLFLEERLQSSGNDLESRVKLKKRQFNGSFLDQDNKTSYMEKIVDMSPPEEKIMTAPDDCEVGLEIVEIGMVSPLKESMKSHKSLQSSLYSRELEMKPSTDDFSGSKVREFLDRVPGLNHGSDNCKILKLDKGEDCMDIESNSQVSVDDGFTSEIENYVDAVATVESEIGTDSQCRKTSCYSKEKPIVADFYENEGRRRSHSLFSDSQSVGNSTTSEDANNFFKERENSSCSDSVSSIAESPTDPGKHVAVIHDDMSFDCHQLSKGIPRNETEERERVCDGAVECDDIPRSTQGFGQTSNVSCLTGVNTIVLPTEASLGEKSLLGPPLDKEYSSFVNPGGVAIRSAPKRTDCGHWSVGELPLNDEESRNTGFHPEISHVSNTLHDFVHLAHIASGKADPVISSVEDHVNDKGVLNLNASSGVKQSVAYPPTSDAKYPGITNQIVVIPNVDCFASSTSENSEDLYSTLECTESLNIEEKVSGKNNIDHASLFDSALALPSSRQDDSTEKIVPDPQAEKDMSSCPIIGINEALPPVSNAHHTHSLESSFSEIAEPVERADSDFVEAATLGTVSFGADPSSKAVFGSADETGEQRPGNKFDVHGDSVSVGENEPDAILNAAGLKRASVSQNFALIHQYRPEPVWTDAYLDGTGTKEIQNDVTNEHECYKCYVDDKSRDFSCHAFPSDMPTKPAISSNSTSAAEDNPALDCNLVKAEYIEIVANGCREIEAEKDLHEDVKPLYLSEFLYAEKLKDRPLSLSEKCHQNEEKSILGHNADLATQKDVVAAQDALVNSKLNISSNGSSPLILLDDLLAEDVPDYMKLVDGVEAPLISENGTQYMDSTSAFLIQTPEYFDNDGCSITTLCSHAQHSVPKSPPKSAGHMVESSREPLKSSSVCPSSLLSGSCQAILEVNAGQLGRPCFPALDMLPGEPLITLDPPPLPPLPPMQWRLGRFQNYPTAAERQIVQQTPHAMQPVSLPTTNVETKIVARSPKTQGHRGCSDGKSAQQGVLTLPVPLAFSDVSSQNDIIEIVGEDNHSFAAAQTSISSQNINQTLEECSQHNMNPPESESTVEAYVSEAYVSGSCPEVLEENLNTEIGYDNGRPEDILQVTEQKAVNSQGELPLSSTEHSNWNPHPGFDAPETRSILPCNHDGVPINSYRNADVTVQNRPQRPRNPLIDEVVAIDKSKLRKVERVKPPLESKGDEGESLLEQLQLRKVGERPKPQVESTTAEIGPLLGQLQLRKVEDRVKPEADPRSEERESPRMQLRKVVGRAHSIVRPKTEDRDSLLEQIRNKSFNLRPAVMDRPNVQGPRTNLRVAAVLQKASNIRQAMAGSDEEDDADNWSDC